LLVPAGDPDAVAAAVLDLLADRAKAERLAAAGREYVQRYSWSSVRGRLFEVYASLIAKAQDGPVGLAK
jgi:phosphatidylinositol alpha-mannosyltransferase